MTVKKPRTKQSVKSDKKAKASPESSKKTTKKVASKKAAKKSSLSRAAKSGQTAAVKKNAASRKKAVGKAAGLKKTTTTKKKTTPKKAVAKKTVDNGKEAIERRLRGRKKIGGGAKKKAAQPRSKTAVSSSTAARAAASADKTAKTRPRKKLLARDRNALRKILLEMRQHFSEQIEYLTKSSLERYDSVNSVEDGTDAFERQFALTIAGSEQESLAAIDEALNRLDQGDYGWCESCNEMISIPRLKALPFVTTCVKCQSEMESGRRRKRVVV